MSCGRSLPSQTLLPRAIVNPPSASPLSIYGEGAGGEENCKFRRQHPISEGFILDFYCVETKVAIELDGAHHQLNEQKEYDKNRTEFLEELGIRIIRILNQEVLNNKENVLRKIIAFTNSPPPSHS